MDFLRNVAAAIAARVGEEPVYTAALFNSILVLALGFGAPISKEQAGLLEATFIALLAWLTRKTVQPV